MHYRIIILFTLLLIPVSALFSQQLSFTSYTSANGLSQNSGYCMAQDGQGYLWMGTQDGLNKFNGKNIITFYKENTRRGNLTDNFIRTLLYDSLNNWLWIGTSSGLCIYNCRADSFYNATHYFPAADTLNGLMIRSIVAGRTPEEILVLTYSEGLFICNTKQRLHRQFFQQPHTKNNTEAAVVWNNEIAVVANRQLFFIKDSAEMILADSRLDDVRKLFVWQQKLWAASTKSGVMVIDSSARPAIRLFNAGSSDVGTFAVDKNNHLWIGTRNAGIAIIEPGQFNVMHSFTDAANQNEWPQKFTLSLFKDRQNNMWTGSSGGGFAVNNGKKNDFALIQKKELQYGKAAHNMILSIYKAPGNLLYEGTQLEGMRIYDLATDRTISVINPGGASANSVYSITASSPASIWVASVAGLYNFNSTLKKFTHYVDSSMLTSITGQYVYKLKGRDSLLYSSYHGAVFFDLKNKKFRVFKYQDDRGKQVNLVVHNALEDAKGNIWLGCVGYGLVRYNITTHAIEIIDAVKAFSKTVNALFDDNGVLWAGTTDGLIAYDIASGKILHTFSAANGLPGNVIYSIEKDAQGNFWCGTNVGLLKIDPRTNKIIQVKASAGLQADEFNTACSDADDSGNLYFGGINGVTFFNPSAFSVDKFSPEPLIESFKIANKEIDLDEAVSYRGTIELNHSQNFITLQYGVNNFLNHDECQYKYRLKNVDADWVFSGNRSFVNYSGLTPGEYKFQLQSSNSNGIWSNGIKELTIIIYPAWWQTWWFRLIVLFSAIALLIVAVANTISGIRYKAAIKQKMVETEMAALKAQMNPHFMFNCINSIDAFIQTNDKYNATLYLNKFAKLIRNVLDSSKQNLVNFSKDIDTLKLYLELELLRNENKFSVQLDIADEVANSDYKVPPLIIQPFVENAIVHGLRNKEGNAGKLEIVISKTATHIVYTITDNGIGRLAAQQLKTGKDSSYGITMSYERIKLLNEEETAAVIFTDLYNDDGAAGTHVIVNLKIK